MISDNLLERRRWQCRELIQSPCNFCSGSSVEVLTYENALPIVQCQYCGLVYVNPHPSDRELEIFYSQYLRTEVSDKWKSASKNLFMTDSKRIAGYCQIGRILDIGCGFGFFPDLMRKKGWDAWGCDLSDVAVRYAQDHLGLPHIAQGHFQNMDFPENYFDVITMWYVLHHLSDPRKALEKAHAALKKNGIIAIRLPNINLFNMLWFLKKFDCQILRAFLRMVRRETADPLVPYNVLDPPVHLFAFSPKVIVNFLEQIGFSVIRTYNDGMVNRGNIINHLVDGTLTHLADIIRQLSRTRLDLSISFSVYAKKI